MSLTADQKRMAHALMLLPQPEEKVQCMYLWVDGTLRNFRDKSKTWHEIPRTPQELPSMEFCGSATYFDVGDEADYYSNPVRIYKDPFRPPRGRIVLCETYCREGLPTFANNRYRLVKKQPPLTSFVFDQSYSLLRSDGRPLCYMDPAYDADSKATFSCGRGLAESHYRACLYAGVQMTGLEHRHNEQWRYSIGPSRATHLGDDVWTSRFLLEKVAEDFGVRVAFQTDATLKFESENFPYRQQQAIIDSLMSVGSVAKAQIRGGDIVLSNIHGDVDPYSFVIKVLDVLQQQLGGRDS